MSSVRKSQSSPRRRCAAPCVAIVAGVVCLLLASVAGAASLPASMFAPTSWPNQRVDNTSFQVATNSATIVNGLDQLVNGVPNVAAGHGTYVSADGYAYPIYVVDSTIRRNRPGYTPRVPVSITNTPTAPFHVALQSLINSLGGVPIPSYAQPAAGTDGIIDIYDSATDTLYEFWHFCPQTPASVDPSGGGFSILAACQSRPGQSSQIGIQATAETGGIVQNVSTSDGYFNAGSYPGYSWWSWGTLAADVTNLGGETTIAELQSGQINHAVAAALPAANGGLTDSAGNPLYHGTLCTNKWVFPAQQRGPSYTTNTAADCVPEGTRLRLNLTDTQIGALNLSPVARMYALAAAHYGVVLRERSGTAPAFLRESPYPIYWQACPLGVCGKGGAPINPYTGHPFGDTSTPASTSIFAGQPLFQVMNNFPWKSMQVQKPVTCSIPQAGCPAVSVSSPGAGSVVTGTVTVTGTQTPNATANIVGVQFKVDGVNIGAEDTAAPWSVSWNTSTLAKGTHSLTATARDGSNLLSGSPAVQVTVG